MTNFPQVPIHLTRWSWLSTRMMLSCMFLMSLVDVFKNKDKRAINEKLIYSSIAILTILILIVFATVPVPFPRHPDHLIARPLEIVPVSFSF